MRPSTIRPPSFPHLATARPAVVLVLILFLLVLTKTSAAGEGPVLAAKTAAKLGNPQPLSLVSSTQQPCPAPISSQPEPGAADPMGSPGAYLMFPDDELFVPGVAPFAGGGEFLDYTYLPGGFLQNTGTVQFLGDTPDYSTPGGPQIRADAGRVTTQEYDQIVYVRRETLAVDLFFADKNTTTPTYSTSTLDLVAPPLADRAPNLDDFLDVAVADLDKLPDANGNNHDEVVVVWASNDSGEPPYDVNVMVLDYTSTPGGSFAPSGTALAKTPVPIVGLPEDENGNTILGVTLGDFDEDGFNEIAVTHMEDAAALQLSLFRYQNDGQGNRTLTFESQTMLSPPDTESLFSGTVSITSGDLDGAGKDEVIIAYETNLLEQAVLWYTIYQLDSQSNVLQVVTGESVQTFQALPSRVQVEVGLFHFDPDNGYDFGRSQFALAWNNTSNNLTIRMFLVDSNFNVSQLIEDHDALTGGAGPRFSIAPGGYRGNGDTQQPAWAIAFRAGTTEIAIFDSQDNSTYGYPVPAGQVSYPSLYMPLVAYDYDGDSLFLGAPVHIQAEGVINTDTVLYEPPKHAFYDSFAAAGHNPTNQVINISRLGSFNLTTTDSSGTQLTSSSQDNSNWTIGGSAAVTAKASVEGGVPEVASVSISIADTAKIGYSYNSTSQETDSSYTSSTISHQGTTNADDWVAYRAQVFDIWRYRVYGTSVTDTQNNTSNAYFDYVLPGPCEAFQNSGIDTDWYQPTHENGNILSYPFLNQYVPPDVGSFPQPDGTTFDGTLASGPSATFGGSSSSHTLTFQSQQGSTTQKSYSHTLTESNDFDVTTSASADIDPATKVSASLSVDLNFNNSNSWSKTTTNGKTTNDINSVTLNVGGGETFYSYQFYPVIYTSQDGTLKSAFSVQIPPNSFWYQYYGQLPDPALNLPQRFGWSSSCSQGTTDCLTTNTWDSRKTIRGFDVLSATQNPVTQQYTPLPGIISEAQSVRLSVNVYNYSVSQSTGIFPVQFAYSSTVTSNTPVIIGTTNMSLDPMAMNTAFIEWTPPSVSTESSNCFDNYQIIVTLDPPDAQNPNGVVTETYESEQPNVLYPWTDDTSSNNNTLPNPYYGLDPGQNNQGYAYVSVQSSASSCNSSDAADPRLVPKSIQALDTKKGKLTRKNVQGKMGEFLRLRFRVKSDKPNDKVSHLLIYDGDPDKGGVLIADKRVHIGNPKGAAVWFDWLPQRVGPHRLYARLLNRLDDPNHNNNQASLKVTVAPMDVCGPKARANGRCTKP
jgi:hypothetical protein